MCVAAGLSLLGGFFLFQRHVGGAPLLKYEPRRRAPWGPLVLCIPLLFVLSGLAQAVYEKPPAAVQSTAEDGTNVSEVVEEDEMTADQFVVGALIFSALQLTFVIAAVAWFSLDGRVRPSDYGWPESAEQIALDVVRGVVACMAALLPVLILNIILFNIVETQQQHPMIEQFQKGSTPLMFFAGAFAAVVSAPIFEEFAFRVLLQGWLEKLEDESLDYLATEREPVEEIKPGPHDLSQVPEELLIEPPRVGVELDSRGRPLRGWWRALPHGWLPILISATFFGLAHLGHGVAPIPLVLLGIVLGYLYQRTHRIVPCIAAHMLFNSYSMLLLWLST